MKLLAPERAPTYVDKNKLSEKRQKELSANITSDQIEEQQQAPTSEQSAEGSIKEPGPRMVCTICAYVYDPEVGDEAQGIPPGTPFEDLPDDWECPVCAAAKSAFISEN